MPLEMLRPPTIATARTISFGVRRRRSQLKGDRGLLARAGQFEVLRWPVPLSSPAGTSRCASPEGLPAFDLIGTSILRGCVSANTSDCSAKSTATGGTTARGRIKSPYTWSV